MALPKRRIKDSESRKILEGIIDESTLKTIFSLQSKGLFDYVEGVLKEGKESVILLGRTHDEGKVVVKVFKIEASVFKNIHKYIMGDKRFQNIKRTKRAMVFAWCRKEYSNLKRTLKSGVSVPEVYGYLNNVIVMEFIGGNDVAPQLKDYEFNNKEELFDFFIKLKGEIKKIIMKARLIHGDLSQYNILVYNNKPYIIDWGQSVVLEHPNARDFFERDIGNLVDFFNKKGLTIDFNKTLKELDFDG